jgi:dTDP-glucose 4,6-dehydratase
LAGDATGITGEVLNLGSGTEHSIAEVIQIVSSILGIELLVRERADRVRPPSSEVQRLVADSRKAASQLGWAPRHHFRDALKKTMEWYEANEEVNAYAQTL